MEMSQMAGPGCTACMEAAAILRSGNSAVSLLWDIRSPYIFRGCQPGKSALHLNKPACQAKQARTRPCQEARATRAAVATVEISSRRRRPPPTCGAIANTRVTCPAQFLSILSSKPVVVLPRCRGSIAWYQARGSCSTPSSRSGSSEPV